MSEPIHNELNVEFLNIAGLNPFAGMTSASRGQMFSSHLAQRLVVSGSEERLIQTGMERELAKYTFNIKMPCNGRIIKAIDRYKKTMHPLSINLNPQTIIIYENDDTGEFGIIDVPHHKSFHQYFGFEYNRKALLKSNINGSYIGKDTVLADSPAVTANGGYAYGVNLNVAFMSHPSVSEDGIMIRRGVLDKLSFKTYQTRVVSFGNKKYPINLYGDASNYKCFPTIGEYTREDGLLMCLREYNSKLAPVQMSVSKLMEVDYTFDTRIYVPGRGKVIDIKVHHDKLIKNPTPTGMTAHADFYSDSLKQFYLEVMAEYKRLLKLKQTALKITPDFHRLIIEASCHLDDSPTNRLEKVYRKVPLDDYSIEFTIEYDNIPNIGYKGTDCHG